MFTHIVKSIAIFLPVSLYIFMCGLGFAVRPVLFGVVIGSTFLLIIFYFFIDYGIYTVLFINPFDRLTALGPGSPITVTKIVIAIVGIIFIFKTILTKNPRLLHKLHDNPVTICGYFFLIFSLSSAVNAFNLEIFSFQLIRRFSCFALYVIIVSLIDSEEKLIRALKILILSYLFIGITGIYELWTGQGILEARFGKSAAFELHLLPGEGLRISGPYGDPNFYAVAMILPLVLCVMFIYLNNSKFLRALLFCLFCFFLINILGTNSRGGLIGALLALSVTWVFLEYKWKIAMPFAAIGIFLVVIGFYKAIIPEASLERYTGESGFKSIHQRIGLIEMSTEIIREYPILGMGTGNFIPRYHHYANEKVPRNALWPNNSLLQVWAENGIFGLLSYILIFFFSIRNSLIVVLFEKAQPLRSIALAVLAILVGLFFFAAVNNVLENQDYWIVFAFSTIVWEIYRTRQKQRIDLEA